MTASRCRRLDSGPANTSLHYSPEVEICSQVFGQWRKPFLTAFSDGDPVTRGSEAAFQQRVPGAQGRDHPTIEGAGHFLQETHGEELAEVIASFIAGRRDRDAP